VALGKKSLETAGVNDALVKLPTSNLHVNEGEQDGTNNRPDPPHPLVVPISNNKSWSKRPSRIEAAGANPPTAIRPLQKF